MDDDNKCEKTIQQPVSADKQKTNKRKKRRYSKLSPTIKKWAAFLTAHGETETAVAQKLTEAGVRVSQQAVSDAFHAHFIEGESPFPIPSFSNQDLVDNSRKLLALHQIETFYDSAENHDWGSIALTQKNLYAPIWEDERLNDELTLKNELLTLEKIMQEEDLPDEALEILQSRYDRLTKKGRNA